MRSSLDVPIAIKLVVVAGPCTDRRVTAGEDESQLEVRGVPRLVQGIGGACEQASSRLLQTLWWQQLPPCGAAECEHQAGRWRRSSNAPGFGGPTTWLQGSGFEPERQPSASACLAADHDRPNGGQCPGAE